jgi:hypothetical protein
MQSFKRKGTFPTLYAARTPDRKFYTAAELCSPDEHDLAP